MILKIMVGACCLILSILFWTIALTLTLESNRASVFKQSRNPQGHTVFFSYVLVLLWRTVTCTVHL